MSGIRFLLGEGMNCFVCLYCIDLRIVDIFHAIGRGGPVVFCVIKVEVTPFLAGKFLAVRNNQTGIVSLVAVETVFCISHDGGHVGKSSGAVVLHKVCATSTAKHADCQDDT